MSKIIAFSDGGCRMSKNVGSFGVAMYDESNKLVLEYSKASSNTSNNREELKGLITVMYLIKKNNLTNVDVYLDSEYSLKGIFGTIYKQHGVVYNGKPWIENWKKNNWKNSAKKPVENKDLWEMLDAIFNEVSLTCDITAYHVRGHNKDVEVTDERNDRNNYVDYLCNKAMDEFLLKSKNGVD